jgi:hypothetical protein
MVKTKNSSGDDKYKRLKYPREKPSGHKYTIIKYSPTAGKWYRVRDLKSGRIIEGFLDHSARMFGGAVLGFIYNESGKLLGSEAVTKYAVWEVLNS